MHYYLIRLFWDRYELVERLTIDDAALLKWIKEHRWDIAPDDSSSIGSDDGHEPLNFSIYDEEFAPYPERYELPVELVRIPLFPMESFTKDDAWMRCLVSLCEVGGEVVYDRLNPQDQYKLRDYWAYRGKWPDHLKDFEKRGMSRSMRKYVEGEYAGYVYKKRMAARAAKEEREEAEEMRRAEKEEQKEAMERLVRQIGKRGEDMERKEKEVRRLEREEKTRDRWERIRRWMPCLKEKKKVGYAPLS